MTDKEPRLIDEINEEAKRQAKAGKVPKTVRINPYAYRRLIREFRDEIEKMRKRAARLFKADWTNFIDIAEEAFPVDSIYTQIGYLKFEVDEGMPGGFEVE